MFVLRESIWLTWGRKGLPWGLGSRGKLYRLIIKCKWSKSVFKDFLNTLRAPPVYRSRSLYIVSHKKYISLNMAANLSKTVPYFLKIHGNLWNVITVCYVSKNAAIILVFFCHISKTVPKSFQSFSWFLCSISTSHLYH